MDDFGPTENPSIVACYPATCPAWQKALIEHALEHLYEYMVAENTEALSECIRALGVCRVMSTPTVPVEHSPGP